ncbi:MAG: fibronectin type III domain-containing protein, partial [Gemmatimonadales bacterium]
MTVLPAPTGLSAKPNTAAAITLAWTDQSSTETGFEVWRSTTGATGTFARRATTGANVKSWKDTGLTTATQYCYRVRAVGGTGVTPSEFTATACASTLLKTPTDFVATVSASSAILLTWTDKLTAEAGFEVWRSTTGSTGTYAPLATVPANVTWANDAGLGGGLGYCYKVRALGGSDVPASLFSTVSCATTPSATMVRLVLFGDSNTDRCENVLPPNRISSYVSVKPRLKPADPPLACSVPGKVDSAWRARRT